MPPLPYLILTEPIVCATFPLELARVQWFMVKLTPGEVGYSGSTAYPGPRL